MLEYLRNAADKPVAKILMGLLIFSFVGWGVAEWVFSGNISRENTLIKVGSTSVSVEQFNAERSRSLANLSRDQQKQIYTDAISAEAFYNNVMTEMVNDVMIENRAHDMGFVVTDKRVAREIRGFPEFQDNGQFSTYQFDYYLNSMNMSEKELANNLRNQILHGYVLGSLSMPINVPEFAVRASYNSRYATRKIEYTTVKFGDFKVGNPTDNALREYYAKNPKMNPETRKVSYILVSANMDKPDEFDAAYARAQKLEDAIIAGTGFEESAKKLKAKYVSVPAFSQDKKQSDEILDDAMVSKIFAMDEGAESELIETKKGFVILVVDKVTPSAIAEFDSVKKGLIDGWKHEEQKKQAYLAANERLVDLNAGKGLRGKTSATVSRTSGAPTDLLVAAFNQSVGTNTLVPGRDVYYVLRIDAEVMPKVDDKKMADLRKELQNVQMRHMMEDYNSFLIREYPVKINTKTFQKFFKN